MYDIIELNGKLVTELREIAKELKITKHDKLLKPDLIFKEFHGFKWVHVCQVISEYPDSLQGFLIKKQVLAAGAGCNNIDGRINPFVR